MDFGFSPQENEFRTEIREFLRSELGEAYREPVWSFDKDWSYERDYLRRIAKRGYLMPAWPLEYGGLALGVMKQTIFNEEMYYHGSPHFPLLYAGMDLLGQTLMVYGSDEQKAEHLPKIAAGEVVWCQGFSEPDSGSDLASLQCNAVVDGDDLVVNGTKIWTTGAHFADWMFLLVRTDPEAPKHRGISFLMTPMHARGITHRPLLDASGQHIFNQEFFEDVRIPRKNLVGELNRGWYVATATLDFERSGISWAARSKRRIDDLIAYCRDRTFQGRRLIDHPAVLAKLTERTIEIECARYVSYRVASMQEAGLIPNQEASMAKLFGSETQQRVARIAMDILGLQGQVLDGAPALYDGDYARWYVDTLSDTIVSGSSEVQRNIIATRGLGLPRA